MSAYLFSGDVRSLIVPAAPPADVAVAPNYERFDGLVPPDTAYSPGMDNPAAAVPFGFDYGDSPRNPGGPNTPVSQQVYTPGPIAGVVGTLGGQPQPVAHWADGRPRGFTPAPPRNIGGPKMGRQRYNGLAETVFFRELQDNPPVPGDLASIMAGLA